MPTSLSPTAIDRVKATVPALEVHGVAIAERTYERLLRHEAIRDLFSRAHIGARGSQPKALAGAVVAYARNIDNLGVLAAAVERIAQKHVSLSVLPEHYPYVADALLAAIKDVLGGAASDDVLAAWDEAYWFLAERLIGREATLYRDLSNSGESSWPSTLR